MAKETTNTKTLIETLTNLEHQYQNEVKHGDILGYEIEIINNLIHATLYMRTISLVNVIDVNGNLIDQYDCDIDKEDAFYAKRRK